MTARHRDAQTGSRRLATIGLTAPDMLGPFVGGVEIIAVGLVLLGLGTRSAAVPLITIMCVAFGSRKWPILVERGFWAAGHDHARTGPSCWVLCSWPLEGALPGSASWFVGRRAQRPSSGKQE